MHRIHRLALSPARSRPSWRSRMTVWRFKSCSTCGGDLGRDEDLWKCWQCGRYHYSLPSLPLGVPPPEPDPPDWVGVESRARERRRSGYGGRAGRNINVVVEARQISDEKWVARNRDVIAFLDEGRTVREIAWMTSKAQRQIRVVRERLVDLRLGAPYLHPISGGEHGDDVVECSCGN